MKSPVSLNLQPCDYFKLFSLVALHTCDVISQVSLHRSPDLGAEGQGGRVGREWGGPAMHLCGRLRLGGQHGWQSSRGMGSREGLRAKGEDEGAHGTARLW